jgi:hypothetical protein
MPLKKNKKGRGTNADKNASNPGSFPILKVSMTTSNYSTVIRHSESVDGHSL